MRFDLVGRDVPTRLATGGYILHSGLEKWKGSEQQAAGVHGMAVGAYPFLKAIPPTTFLKVLSAAEIATGTVLLVPVFPAPLAGAALTAFSGGLVGMYLRTDSLHKPNSVWPTPAGIGISKDVWMLGIGVGLLTDKLTHRRGHEARKAARVARRAERKAQRAVAD